jgi:hypothetical protein
VKPRSGAQPGNARMTQVQSFSFQFGCASAPWRYAVGTRYSRVRIDARQLGANLISGSDFGALAVSGRAAMDRSAADRCIDLICLQKRLPAATAEKN